MVRLRKALWTVSVCYWTSLLLQHRSVCVFVHVCVYREGRDLPDDRRGACCFLLGMLLQEFPLDFSCREQNSGRAAEEPMQPDQITASSVSSALRAAALKCRSPARVEKSLFFYR